MLLDNVYEKPNIDPAVKRRFQEIWRPLYIEFTPLSSSWMAANPLYGRSTLTFTPGLACRVPAGTWFMSYTSHPWIPRCPTYATDNVELKGSSRCTVKFQFHAAGCFRFRFKVVNVKAAAVPLTSEDPGLSTLTLLTVTNGWKGE